MGILVYPTWWVGYKNNLWIDGKTGKNGQIYFLYFIDCDHRKYERLQLLGQETHLICSLVSNSQVTEKTCKNRSSLQHDLLVLRNLKIGDGRCFSFVLNDIRWPSFHCSNYYDLKKTCFWWTYTCYFLLNRGVRVANVIILMTKSSVLLI